MFRKIKNFIQRGQRGYSDEDLWSFDSYLSEIMIGGLLQLKEQLHGYPGIMKDVKEWEDVLENIIEGFEAAYTITNRSLMKIDKDGKTHLNDEGYRILMEKFNKGMDLLKENYFALWD